MATKMTDAEKLLEKYFGDYCSIRDYRKHKKEEAKAHEKWVKQEIKETKKWARRVEKSLGRNVEKYTFENISKVE